MKKTNTKIVIALVLASMLALYLIVIDSSARFPFALLTLGVFIGQALSKLKS